MVSSKSLISTAVAGLALCAVANAQSTSLDFARIDGPVGRVQYDVESGKVTRVVRPGQRGTMADAQVGGVQKASVNCFLNTITTGYFTTGSLGAEWVDWATKATGKTITTSIIFGYATTADDTTVPGGSGASLDLSFYSGTTGFCVLGTETDRFTFTGLPGKTASIPPGYGVGFFVTAFLGNQGICVPDGPIGWGYCFLDSNGMGGSQTGPIMSDFGTNAGWSDAFDWWALCPANTGTCVGAFFFGGCSTGAVPPPPAGVPCADFMLGLTEWVPVTAAACVVQNPPPSTNPVIFAATSPPVIGGAYSAVVGAAPGTIVAMTVWATPVVVGPLTGTFNGYILGITQLSPILVAVTPGGFNIPVPKDVTLEGLVVYPQAARRNAPMNWTFTNRQACVFGG